MSLPMSIMKDFTAVLKTSKVNALGPKAPRTRSVLVDLAEPLVSIPPDGGWGWAVMSASTLIMFCIDGVGYSFAIFFEEMMRDFQCELTDIALLSALSGGFYYLLGPVTCSAVNRFGFQVVAASGGAIAAVSYLLASFITSLPLFLTIVGMVGGFAFNLVYTPSVIAIGFYFEKWRALAMAVSCCGSSLGVVVFPLVAVQLFGDWPWRSKFRMLAGMFAVCGLLGLVFKPIKATRVERTVQFGQVSQLTSAYTLSNESEVKFGTGIAAVFQRFKNALFPTISEASMLPNEECTRHDSKTSSTAYSFYVHGHDEDDLGSTYLRPYSQDSITGGRSATTDVLLSNQEVGRNWIGKCRRCCSRISCKGSACCKSPRRLSFSNVNRPLYRDDIFYGGSVYRLSHYSNASVPMPKDFPSLAYTLSVSRAPTQRDLEQQGQCVCCPEAVIRVLATMLHVQMLKSPAFILLLFSGYLSLMATYVVFTYAAQFALKKGLSPKLAAFLLSFIGISNTIGRATCGGISCWPILDMTIISWVTIGCSGVSIILAAFAYSGAQYLAACALFGFNLASFAVLRALLFVEFFGLENLTNCFGLNMVFQSLAAFTGTPLANFILRATGSFDTVFVCTGGALLASGVVLIPIKRVLKWEQRCKKKVTFT